MQKSNRKIQILEVYIMKYRYFKQFSFTDSFKVSGTSGLSTPIICGSNAGQHSKFAFNESIANLSSRIFLLRQIWIVNYSVKNPIKHFQ